jgi:hypothetical protein
MTQYKSFWEAAPFVGGGALLLGGGARVGKGLLDLLRRPDPEGAPEKIEKQENPVVEIPVPVTAEEAAELRRKGVRVKKAGFLDRFDVDAGDAFLLGGLGTAAAMGGWALTDKLVDTYRKNRALQKREKVRRRIQSMLDDKPAPEDVPLYTHMKAAEALYFMEKRGALSDLFSVQRSVINPIAALLGGAALLSGVRAYRSTAAAGETDKVKALKAYLKRQKTQQPIVSTVPVEVSDTASPTQQSTANALTS